MKINKLLGKETSFLQYGYGEDNHECIIQNKHLLEAVIPLLGEIVKILEKEESYYRDIDTQSKVHRFMQKLQSLVTKENGR